MKRILFMIFASCLLVLSACGNDDTDNASEDDKLNKEIEEQEEEQDEIQDQEDGSESEEDVEEVSSDDSEDDEQEENGEIDTSVFEYATGIEVTDAIDINEHVTVIIDMSEELSPGLAFQHIVNQTYDFIQQDDVQAAKTFGINIRQGGNKIAMFTVDRDKFKPNDDEPMADLVLEASIVEMALPEVEQFAETMDMQLNKE